jgi:hypothetical protein
MLETLKAVLEGYKSNRPCGLGVSTRKPYEFGDELKKLTQPACDTTKTVKG